MDRMPPRMPSKSENSTVNESKFMANAPARHRVEAAACCSDGWIKPAPIRVICVFCGSIFFAARRCAVLAKCATTMP
jgi:hypothetical protein